MLRQKILLNLWPAYKLSISVKTNWLKWASKYARYNQVGLHLYDIKDQKQDIFCLLFCYLCWGYFNEFFNIRQFFVADNKNRKHFQSKTFFLKIKFKLQKLAKCLAKVPLCFSFQKVNDWKDQSGNFRKLSRVVTHVFNVRLLHTVAFSK